MIWGRCSIRLEFGEGSSARCIASAAASSTSSARSVETLRTSNERIMRLTMRKIKRPRRMMKAKAEGERHEGLGRSVITN